MQDGLCAICLCVFAVSAVGGGDPDFCPGEASVEEPAETFPSNLLQARTAWTAGTTGTARTARTQVTSASKEPCKRWCLMRDKPWEEKCQKRSNCRGCKECNVDPLPASGGCKSACESDPLKWEKKCTWPECGGCSACAIGSGEGGGGTPTANCPPEDTDDSWVRRPCERWCLKKQDAWTLKCGKKDMCGGCPECHRCPYPASPSCPEACVSDPLKWSRKCKVLYECTTCPQCIQDYNPGATTPPPAFPVPPINVSQVLPGGPNRTLDVAAGNSSASVQLASGEPYMLRVKLLSVVSSTSGVAPRFSLEGSAPAGLHLNSRSGVITWQPGAHQVGEHSVLVVASSEANSSRLALAVTVSMGFDLPAGIYVWLAGGSDDAEGSAAAPFATVAHAVAAASPGDTVFIRGGTYSAKEVVVAAAPRDKPVLITRLPGERVCLVAQRKRHVFEVPEGSTGITFRGLELDGNASHNDHWTVLRRSWWRVNDEVIGGWNGFLINGQHIVIEHNSIHDFNSKGVDIVKARYVTVHFNLIYNIGWASLSGGGGIHRKWDATFRDPDDWRLFRWDVFGNAIWAVEQRLYSYVPKQKWALLALDEGKPMSFDSTRDTQMKARVAHNLVLYGGIVHIRLMVNPNLQVHNNAVFAEPGRFDPLPDGITCKGKGSFNEGKSADVFGGKIENLTLFSNLVHTSRNSTAFGMTDQFDEADNPARINHNYYSGGSHIRPEYQPGLISLPSAKAASVFRNPRTLDFRPSDPLPQGVGVDKAVLDHLFALADDFGATIAPSGFRHDHCRNLRVILESTPLEHLSRPGFGDSRYHKGLGAYKFAVRSDHYRQMCKCSEIELIVPAHLAKECLH